MSLLFHDLPADSRAIVRRIDADHGNVLKLYAAMGSPLDPTQDQVDQLNRESARLAEVETKLKDGKIDLSLTPDSLALILIPPK